MGNVISLENRSEKELKKLSEMSRKAAKGHLHNLFQVPQGYIDERINATVDCIINTSIVELVLIHKATMKRANRRKK